MERTLTLEPETGTSLAPTSAPEIEAAPGAPSAEDAEALLRPLTLGDLIAEGSKKAGQEFGTWYGAGGKTACFLGTALIGAKERGLA